MTLLERWAKAEPERVSIGRDCAFLTSGHGDFYGFPAAWTFAVESVTDPKVLGFIVAAIEARGWGLCIVTSESGYSTSVRVPYRGLFYGSGAQLSEALLTAHLAALDAVEGEG